MLSYKINRSFISFLFCVQCLWAQNFPSRNYSAANELPNNAVRALFVDRKNVLWIGTENGIVSKQNNIFQSYFEEDGLALNSCWAITEDKQNRIWFGSYGSGISVFNGDDFKILSTKDGLVHDEIVQLFPYKNYIYVGTSDGVSRIDINTFDIQSWKNEGSKALLRVSGFFEFEKELYVTTYRNGVFKVSSEGSFSLKQVNDQRYIYSAFIDNNSIFSSNKGHYTKSEISEYIKSGEPASEELGNSIIWDYVKTSDSTIYAAAWGIYDSNGGIFELNEDFRDRTNSFGIQGNDMYSLAYDEAFERLYIGTLSSGVYEIQLKPLIKFEELFNQNIQGFAEIDGNTAYLLEQGVQINSATNQFFIQLLDFKRWQQNYLRTTTRPLPEHKDDFYELDHNTTASNIKFYDIKTSNNLYWINSNIGIFSIDTNGKLDTYLPLHSEEINFTTDGKLIETNPYGGVRIYNDPKKLSYKYYPQDHKDTPTMVVSSLKTDNKTYFTSVFSGLYKYENGRFESYLNLKIWKEKNLRHMVSHNDNLAISSEFGDVFIVRDKPGSFEVLRKIPRASIQGNTISFLNAYGSTLIIGTERGLTLVNDDRFIFMDEEQGLEQPFFSSQIENDELHIGSENGLFRVNIKEVLASSNRVERIQLKGIAINNNEYGLTENALNDLDLDYDENTVLLSFSTNAHPYPKKLQYQYRLNQDEKWSNLTSNSEILLPYLPANNYEVQVRVLDSSTGLNYSQNILNFSIKPPFWKTWWFFTYIFLALMAIVYAIYKYELTKNKRFERQKRAIQRRFEETKMEALLAQMNPHFIFNAMNSIQNYIMDSDIDNATIFLGDFAKLIRLNLDHCTKPTILLVEEIEYLQSYIRVENTRMNNAVEINFKLDPKIDTYDVEVPTMILQTFVENVFVHAFTVESIDPKLDIIFEKLDEHALCCKIIDNGSGFTATGKNRLHNSKGLSLVKERLALLDYYIEDALNIESEPGKGTMVSLKLSLQR
ncbi:sensor histidine kinase [uncultured Christiangramia sp.]|uniref:sensor histidine kinase n=1 Tax=uncultured Christiangramia sp. TaxID=503836 RepID=UPI00262BFAC3|nr:sensor histidine kinase [uncultured Christiangramia sp.]